VVAEGTSVLGVVELKDIVKGGIKERFAELRRMGIKTVMITGDNRLTAAAIAAEAGVDDFLAEATPEAKLALIRQYQAEGRLVAMTGDGTNDAPALAQADVAVAMNTGTQAAKEAGNMVDLDSNPTKLIEVVETGKQMLMTRGSLTTFSIANDVAKYFAIIPAAFVTTYPAAQRAQRDGPGQPASAILSAVIFNALIIVALIPLALKGVATARRRRHAAARNLLIYGLGGLVPFIGIKLIDLAWPPPAWPEGDMTMKTLKELRPAVSAVRAAHRHHRPALSGCRHRRRQLAFPAAGQRQPDRQGRQARRLELIGQNFTDPKYFWGRPSATGPHALQRRRSVRLQPGAAQPGPGRCRQGPHRGAARRRPRQHQRRCRSIW
jgi:soluble P-type ATPase